MAGVVVVPKGIDMLRTLCSSLLFLLLLPSLNKCTAQVPSPVTDAPFTGVRTQTVIKSVGSHTTFGTLARRSNGSGYVELRNSDGTGIVLISDAIHHQIIELDLAHHSYTVSSQPALKVQIRPEGYAQFYMKSAGEPGSKRALDGGLEITTIGRRTIENVDTVGFDETATDGRTFERWYSPALDLNLEQKTHAPALGVDSDTRIEQIHRGEPDVNLFEIPSGYVEYKRNANKICPAVPTASTAAGPSQGC